MEQIYNTLKTIKEVAMREVAGKCRLSILSRMCLVSLILMTSGVGQAWAGTAKGTLNATSSSANGGYVMVSTNSNASFSGTKTSASDSKTASTGLLGLSVQQIKLYAYASAKSGCVFKGWSSTKSTDNISTTNTKYSWTSKTLFYSQTDSESVYALFARLAGSPASGSEIDCGEVTVGGDPSKKTLTIYADHTGKVTLTKSGANASDFTIKEGESVISEFTSKEEATKTITIEFNPSSNGVRECTLTIKSEDSGLSSLTYTLKGTGYNTPSITWEGNDGEELTSGETTLSAGDTLRAACITGQTVTYPSYSSTYFTSAKDANNNPVLIVRDDISGTVNNLKVKAKLDKSTSNYYNEFSDEFTLNVTNLTPQTIDWSDNLSSISDKKINTTITLNAIARNAKTDAATGCTITYEMAANEYFTLAGNKLTVKKVGGPVNIKAIAAAEGAYASASMTKKAKVIDMSHACAQKDTTKTGQCNRDGSLEVPTTFPTKVTFTAKRESGLLTRDLVVKRYTGTTHKDTTIDYYNVPTDGKKFTISCDPSVTKIVFECSKALYHYYFSDIIYDIKTTSSVDNSTLSYETAPGQSLEKTLKVTYSNMPIFLTFKSDEKANVPSGKSLWSVNTSFFGGCEASGTETIKVTFMSNKKGTYTDTLYVRDNLGNLKHVIKLSAEVTPQQQFLDSWNLQNSNTYNTTDKIALSAKTKQNYTDFTFSVEKSTPANIVSIDANGVMTFTASGTATIKAYQPGGGIYDEFSTTHNITINKVTPTIATLPKGTAVTYLQTLENSVLDNSGDARVTLRGVANTKVNGSFAWTNKTYKVVETAGQQSYEVTFTPDDKGMYNSNTCQVKITVNPASQKIEMKDGGVRVKVTGLDAEAADSRLDLSTLIKSQTTDNVAANRVGAVTYKVLSAKNNNENVKTTAINGNIFTATACDVYTIRATKAATSYYSEATDEFDVTVSKRANTLTVVGAQTKYVDVHVTSVASNINSDATLQYSSTAEDIARYDAANNKIVVDNKDSKLFTDTLVTISIWQEANSQFEASGTKTIKVTVKKHENALAHTWNSAAANWSTTHEMNFDQSANVAFTATNKETGCPKIEVTPKTGLENARYDADKKQVIAACNNNASATWEVSQAETRTYCGATATLKVKVATIASPGCDLYFAALTDKDTQASEISFVLPETGTAKSITFEMKKNGLLGDDAKLCRLVGTQWDTIHIWAKSNDWGGFNVEKDLPNPIPLDPNTTQIRFDKYSGSEAIVGSTLTFDDPYIRNIHVARTTWLLLEDADKKVITELEMPTNTVSMKGSNSKTAKFYINYSTCDDYVHIASNNANITASVSEFAIDHLGRKEITLTYTSNTIEDITATITVYTKYENKTLLVKAKTEKESQSIIWNEGFTDDPMILPLHLQTSSAAISTSNYPVTYLSGDSKIIEVSEDGMSFKVVGIGTTTLTAQADGDDTHWKPVTETKSVSVTDKKIQSIVWNHDYTYGLHPGDITDLDAIAVIVNSQTGAGTKNDSLTALIAYEAVENDGVIKFLADNQIEMLKAGDAKIKATLAGSANFEAAHSVIMDVHVREKSTGDCGSQPMFKSENGTELEFYAFNGDIQGNIISGFYWKTPEVVNYVDLHHDNTSGAPDTLTYKVRGKSYYALKKDHFQGIIEVYQSIDGGSNWSKVANSEVTPIQDSTVSSGKILLNHKATHLKFVRPENGQGYHYVSDIQVTRLASISSDNENVNGLPEVDLGDVLAGAARTGYITVEYASVKGDLTTSKQNSTNTKNELTIDEPVIELDCGAFGSHDLPITFRPKVVGSWSEEVKITDEFTNMSYTVRVKANVTQGTQSIVWNPDTTLTFGETVSLNAYATSGLPVKYEITDVNNICDTIGGKVVFVKAGKITITVTQAGNTSFTAAKPVEKNFEVTNEEIVFIGDGDWSDPNMWQALEQPTESDDVKISGNVTITEEYTVNGLTILVGGSVTIAENGVLTVNGNSEDQDGYGNLIVEEGGEIVLNGNQKVNDFVIKTNLGELNGANSSGQVENPLNLDVKGNAYIDITLAPAEGFDETIWYGFALPFDVDAKNGVYRYHEGEVQKVSYMGQYATAKFSPDTYMNGGRAWQYYNGTLYAGVFYFLTVDDNLHNIYRFKKNATASIQSNSPLNMNTYGDSSNPKANWNPVGNSTLTYANAEFNGNDYVQVYQNGQSSYMAVPKASASFVVGCPFFVQETMNETMTLVKADNNKKGGAYYAPRRTMAQTSETFQLQIAAEGDKVSDQVFVSAAEDALDSYEMGRDLAKAGISNKCAQIWVNAYNQQLCVNEAVLSEEGQATFNLTLFAPKAGEYTLSVEDANQNGELFLTKNGVVIWNLNDGAYVAELTKGNNTEYGLMLKPKANQVTTGIEGAEDNQKIQKFIMDGRLYILKDGVLYDGSGKKVK